LGARSCLGPRISTPRDRFETDPRGESYEKPSSCSDRPFLLRNPVSIVNAATEKEAEKRKKDYLRARSLAERAKELGRDSPFVRSLLEKFSADGNPPTLAASEKRSGTVVMLTGYGPAFRKEFRRRLYRMGALEALSVGREAFDKGEMNRAIENYENALKFDPKFYEAQIFIGDAYYKMGKNDKAYESYARAVTIDPDRAAVYRRWGDALMRDGKLIEAKGRLIEGVIAEPYSLVAWDFLWKWADLSQIQLSHPWIFIPTSSVRKKDDKNVGIFVNSSDKKDGTDAWMIYNRSHAAWMDKKKFLKAFPKEKKYRHSLREESESLRAAAKTVDSQLKRGKLKDSSLDISIANLLRLHREGLIEAYVLLAMPDPGIAGDYTEYRKKNRGKLRRYLNEYVTAGK
jgi:tetratricopeptide (TPR) repeat protein